MSESMFSSLRGMGGALLRDFETVMGSTLTAETPSHIHNPHVPLAREYASRAVKCGQLTRLGKQRQQQYFAVLYPCTRLYLFADEDDWQARDCVDLDKADSLIIRRPDGNQAGGNRFEIRYAYDSSPIAQFETDTAEESEEWISSMVHETYSRVRMEKQQLETHVRLLKQEIEGVEAHAYNLQEYADQRQKFEVSLLAERTTRKKMHAMALTAHTCYQRAMKSLREWEYDVVQPQQLLVEPEKQATLTEEEHAAIAAMPEREQNDLLASLKVLNDLEAQTQRLVQCIQALQSTVERQALEKTEHRHQTERVSDDMRVLAYQLQQADNERQHLRATSENLKQQLNASLAHLKRSEQSCAGLKREKKVLVKKVKELRNQHYQSTAGQPAPPAIDVLVSSEVEETSPRMSIEDPIIPGLLEVDSSVPSSPQVTFHYNPRFIA